MRYVWILFWLTLGLLLVAGWMRLRSRKSGRYDRSQAVVDDEALRQIEARGVLTTDEDEPLDLDGIRREERRFWEEEQWDEADEF